MDWMDWVPAIVTTVLTPLLTGLAVFALQLRWQEQMKRRLTRFSRLHERQAEVIATLYALLIEVESAVVQYAYFIWPDSLEGFEGWSGVPESLKQQREVLREQFPTPTEPIKALWSYFEKHRIYLPKPLTETIQLFYYQSVLADVKTQWIDMLQPAADGSADWSDQETSELHQEELTQLVNETIPSLKKDIENEFRELLGS